MDGNLSDHRAISIELFLEIEATSDQNASNTVKSKKIDPIKWLNNKHKATYAKCLQEVINERNSIRLFNDTSLLQSRMEERKQKLEELQLEIETCIELGKQMTIKNLKIGELAPPNIKSKPWWILNLNY